MWKIILAVVVIVVIMIALPSRGRVGSRQMNLEQCRMAADGFCIDAGIKAHILKIIERAAAK